MKWTTFLVHSFDFFLGCSEYSTYSRDSENGNALTEGCESTPATDWDTLDSNGGTTFIANGICVGSTLDTADEAAITSGGNYVSDCSRCISYEANLQRLPNKLLACPMVLDERS